MKQKLQESCADKKRLAIVGLGLVAVILCVIAGFFIFKAPQSASDRTAVWQNYSSDELGFSVWHPADWKVAEELAESGPDILISDKNGSAFP